MPAATELNLVGDGRRACGVRPVYNYNDGDPGWRCLFMPVLPHLPTTCRDPLSLVVCLRDMVNCLFFYFFIFKWSKKNGILYNFHHFIISRLVQAIVTAAVIVAVRQWSSYSYGHDVIYWDSYWVQFWTWNVRDICIYTIYSIYRAYIIYNYIYYIYIYIIYILYILYNM